MKITTRRDALFGQLQTVTRAASTRSAVQALSGVQLLARTGGIELRATDMEIGLRVPLGGLPAIPGSRGQRSRPGAWAGVRRNRPEGGSLRLARRDASGADRHPRVRVGRRA